MSLGSMHLKRVGWGEQQLQTTLLFLIKSSDSHSAAARQVERVSYSAPEWMSKIDPYWNVCDVQVPAVAFIYLIKSGT